MRGGKLHHAISHTVHDEHVKAAMSVVMAPVIGAPPSHCALLGLDSILSGLELICRRILNEINDIRQNTRNSTQSQPSAKAGSPLPSRERVALLTERRRVGGSGLIAENSCLQCSLRSPSSDAVPVDRATFSHQERRVDALGPGNLVTPPGRALSHGVAELRDRHRRVWMLLRPQRRLPSSSVLSG